MRVLVTGIGGFVGAHMAAYLQRRPDVELTGIVKGTEPSRRELPGVRVLTVDLEDAAAADAAIGEARPERIVHLAAQSSVRASWDDPVGTFRANVHALIHMMEALRRRSWSPRVLVVGSADEYGSADEMPLTEDSPLRPASPYAASKVAQGFVALQYALSARMPVIRTRTFPHTGPGRTDLFAESSFARQAAEIQAGRRPPVLSVGNAEVVRDFTDVRDVVRAYWKLLERGEPGEVYNVCSGTGVSLREIAARLLALAGVRAEVQVDPDRLRPADIPALVGDPRRLRRATGWEPRIGLQQTLRDLLDYWRARVSDESAPARAAGG
ncbi:MAG TPA: GDP-mannose 4,6-dehydratase [Vicinamibacteria bacterium]|jgi:GDP-4-dehydro-6-deoxy-D-mannose reductase|nr:GDP-mannose 4,6-dehydratase [Vicinamibacteria bacterium]